MIRNFSLAAAAVVVTFTDAHSPARAQIPAPVGANDQTQIVRDVTDYLNGVETMTGDFVQIAPDGVISEGSFSMLRPGRILFEYLPPNPIRVIADGFWVAVVDDELNQTPDRYPLSETPLNLILRDDVQLDREDSISFVENRDGKYRLTAVDPSGEAQGAITMIFDTDPIALEQWIVVDEQGRETSVILRNVSVGGEVSGRNFVIPDFSLEDERE